jgi:hypothetical protein
MNSIRSKFYLFVSFLFICQVLYSLEQTGELYGPEITRNAVYKAAVAEEGLVGLWQFGSPAIDRVLDLSGNDLHASASGIKTIAGGPMSGSMLTNAYIRIDSNALLMPKYAVSVMAWIRIDQPEDGFQSLYRKEDGDGRLLLMLKDGGEKITFGIGTSFFEANPPECREINSPVTPGRVADGRWHLIAGVYNGLRMYTYLDGIRLQTEPVNGFMSDSGSSPVFIGSTRGKTEFFNGIIRDVRLYSRAISAGEMAALYHAGINDDRRAAEKEIWDAYQEELEYEIKREKKEIEYQALQNIAIKKYNETLDKKFMKPLDVEAMAFHSMRNFMMLTSEPLHSDSSLRPVHFYYQSLPEQVGPKPFGGIDFGDATARAVSNWPGLRAMAGDSLTGQLQQKGAQNVILALLHPLTGLAMQMDSNKPHADTLQYCYMWDQSRVLRTLVRWYSTEPDTREMLQPHIDKYLRAISAIADVRGTDENWGDYIGFSNDYFNADGTFSTSKKKQWIHMRSGIMLEGVVDYVAETDDPFALDLAKQLAACVAGAHEGDFMSAENRMYYGFGENGEYVGHVHTRTCTLLGMAKLAKYLYCNEEEKLAIAYLDIIEKAWNWSFSSGVASKTGWWLEFIGRHSSEIDQCADAIELSAVLGSLSELKHSRFERFSSYYDTCESFLVNYIARSYIKFTPEYETVLKAHWIDDLESKMKRAKATDGSFTGTCDMGNMVRFHGGRQQLLHMACCTQSGIRGMHAGWKAAIGMRDGVMRVNYFLNRKSPYADIITEQPAAGKATVLLKEDAKKILIRIPGWVDPTQMTLSFSGRTVRASDVAGYAGYAEIGPLSAQQNIEIKFPNQQRKMVEEIAGKSYTSFWRGNYVVRMEGPISDYLRMWP